MDLFYRHAFPSGKGFLIPWFWPVTRQECPELYEATRLEF